MLEIRQVINDDTTVVHSRHETYTDANAARRRIGATRAVIDAQPVELELWELIPADMSDQLPIDGEAPDNWVYVNTLTVTVSYVLSDVDTEHDDND